MTTDARFWAKVDTSGECWEWQGYRDRQGYGRVMRFGKNWLTHRYVYFLLNGPTEGVVRHSCDNPPCCNPAHLLEGTQADNIADRQRRGRHRPGRLSGDAHPASKLTWAQVRDLRSRPRHRGDAVIWAREVGISRGVLYQILLGHAWKEAA